MNQSTTTQSKSRVRPVKGAADGLPGGPLPTQSITQNPAARPAIIRAVVGLRTDGQPAEVVLARQDEMSQPTPRMLSEERLQRYVQGLTASESTQAMASQDSTEIPAAELATSDQDQLSNSVVTWTTPQISEVIDLPEATLIQPKIIHHAHRAHPAPEPYLQNWPEESEAVPAVDTQLEQAVEIDEQLKQLELRIDKLSKEASKSKSESDRSIREQEILANPNTRDLVTSISTAIISAIQEKSEAEVMPKAKDMFDKSLQQHAVTLGEQSDPMATTDVTEQANEAMLSSIAAQRQQEQSSPQNSDKLSPTKLLKSLRERIADYQRTMTSQTATEAADLVKLGQQLPSENEPVSVDQPSEAAADSLAVKTTMESVSPVPPVKFTAPEDAALPLEAASWDVEDFRWSSLTNQMLDGGGDAIKKLLEVTLEQTTTKMKRIAVAGAGRGQGTTTIATALTRAANQAGLKTLLIDADVASPQLSQTVGLSAKISWLTGIGTELPLGEVVIRSKKTNLCLMPLSATVNRVTWPRFIFDNLGEMLVKAESYFDLIVVDTGPASQLLDELSNPGQLLDALVLVDSGAKLKDIEVYQNRLQTFGIENLVLAENRKPDSAIDAA